MGLHHTERKRAVARIGKALEARGWTLFGYDPGESDPLTDYFRAASWNGVAVFEDKYPGVIVCVQVADFTVEARAGKYGWPVFQATPKRQGWHIEKEGQIVATGLAYLQKCSDYNHGDQYVSQVVTAIERAAERAMTASADEIAQDDDVFDTNGIRLEYDRDWTWLFFPEKPNSEVRERLKSIGARWGKTRKGWYFRQRVEREELAWLLTSAEEPHRTGEGVVHLILDDEGMDADTTGFEAGKGDAYNYIPKWMKIPPLYCTEKAREPLAAIRLFTPDSNWSWVLSEYDGKDICFGLVVGHETELGYVSLSEIQEVRGPLGLRIERDLWFKPRPITDLPEYKAKWGEHGGPYPGNRETEAAPKAETVVLTSFDNGTQFGYDSGHFGIWGPYTDMQGKRYTHGWTVWDNSPSDIPIPVPDPSSEGDGCKNLGSWSLAEAVKHARKHFGVEIQLEGEPCWQDEYPRLSDAQEPANDEAEIEAWRMTRLAYQKLKAKAHVAGGVPVLNAADGREHKRLVEEALALGEQVPERVLEAYPELSISAALEESEVETLTGDVLDAMERVAKAEIIPDDLPPAQFDKQLTGEAAEALLAEAALIVPEVSGFGDDGDTSGPEPVENTASGADTAGKSNSEDQAEFEQWELQLLTGLVGKPGSVFYKALKAVTRPGALHLALERIEGEQRRCELIEHRLKDLG